MAWQLLIRKTEGETPVAGGYGDRIWMASNGIKRWIIWILEPIL